MLRAIFEVAVWVFIVTGIVAVVLLGYNGWHQAIYDPSVPHDTLWRIFFGN